ncbi:hypothetical protein [Pedobacter jeongneungensis]|uniref:hypothetical protein n=1 Tax=Pedobacter jeongneungensis TaxID=947309 RepID=UPI0013B456A3|nr:hypothetical protein [Pedobacter jeongneungensis]
MNYSNFYHFRDVLQSRYLFIPTLITLKMIFNWPWSKTRKHRCLDGSVKLIFNNIDDAFPLALKDTNIKIEAEGAVQEAATANLKAEHQSKIQSLLFSITDQNQSLMMTFRSAYIGYTTDPCGDGGFFTRQIESITQRQYRLMELRTQITGLISLAEMFPDNSQQITNTYFEIMNQLGGKGIAEMAKVEIKENRENAQEWIGGQNG